MSEQHTYAGHTLAEIKAAAGAATPGKWCCAGFVVTAKELGYDIVADAEYDNDSMAENARHIATANPATVLAMATRIEELERELAEARHANTHAGLRAMYQRAMHDLGTARLEGWLAAREMAAGRCRAAFSRDAAEFSVLDMQPPAEWQCVEVTPVCGAAPNTDELCRECRTCNGLGVIGGHVGQTPENFDYVEEPCPDCNPKPWPHPDGFAGGLTEPSR